MMLPLEGITVIAVEQAVAAPFCSSRLADAGAHVIKVERPEGDFARGYDAAAKGQSSYFVWLNRGKESVVIDLATKEGRQNLEALIAGADVLIQNLKPGSMDKLGFSLARLRKDHAKLICCTISGYGDDGPYAHRKAYDLLIQAESGLASITGGPDGPSRVGLSIVDIATGATAHAAILEALIARSRNGKGADIRISMFDVMADWLSVPLLNAEAGNPPERMGLAHPSIAPYGVFRSKDGRDILISIQSEREWKKLCADVLGQPDLPNDVRFSNMVERVRNRKLTDQTVGDIFATMTRNELLQRLSDADIAFAEVNTMAHLAVHPHLRRIEVNTPAGPVSYAAPDVGRRRGGIFRYVARRRRDDADFAHRGCDDEDRLYRRVVFCIRRSPDRDAARHRDPGTAGHRLSRQLACAAIGVSQAASAASGRAAPRKPHGRCGAAVSLFGTDIQRPPHPLRPRLRHQDRGLSGPDLPRPDAGGVAGGIRGKTPSRRGAEEIQLSRGAAADRRQRIFHQRQRYRCRHGVVDREFGRPADHEGHRDVVIVIASQRVARTRDPLAPRNNG